MFAQLSNIKKNYFLLLIIILLLVINDAVILKSCLFLSKNKEVYIKDNQKVLEKSVDSNNTINVDIKGAVKKPGVYAINNNMTVNDAIKMAGGLKKSATTSNINLSKKLFDQMVIIVSTKSSLKKNGVTEVRNDAVIQKTKEDSYSENTSENNSNLININYASLEELSSLSGVGESKAKAIISYRETNKFNSIEDIKNVSGIGDSLFEKIKNSITI